MTTDEVGGDPNPDDPSASRDAGPSTPPPAARARVLLIDADQPSRALLEEWLGDAGWAVLAADGCDGGAGDRHDLVIVDVPFPRQGGVDLLRCIASRHPMTPILALSSTFFAGIDRCGAVARSLGVSGVLPKPISRETLLDAARRFLPPR